MVSLGYPEEDQCYDPDEPQPQGYFRAQNDKFLQVPLNPHPAHALSPVGYCSLRQ